ncbi:ribosome small subunit-dependent GTPase A [Gloeobacter kilaueensis]|uniref:Small ribosomal subunit biogenesis GTPase RsgA n=1 Tax=Gloeobacter kilaueensis (strain ATCC BAA-2537 / CCAP 1431/1 / ULC 316 / JS1) TaxID=1183438 RepID=U5QHQ9_GLOK1|nr:ribosome small subunit-dependent GTPase A [Gloeobacter kilaueensis]AGY57200.1 ribosome small subunit-dependent GTPase A [Gloeobacter kilaueensis JS1]
MQLSGTVLAQEANFYRVRLDGSDLTLLCTRRARLRKTGGTVLTGDRVEVVEVDWPGGRGAIAAVAPRTSELTKPPIANCSGVLVVFSLSEPPYDPALLSRFLVQVEAEHLPALVCLSKGDEVASAVIEPIVRAIESWGYPARPVSARSGAGIGPLLAELGGTYVLAGPSGAGKSSLLNAMHPGLSLRVGDVSARLGRGRHTTRHVELFALSPRALVADAPGFSQLEITVAPEDLAVCFPEFRPYLGHCQFRNCLHRDEPGCAVRAAGLPRFDIYRSFVAEALAFDQQRRQTSEPEASLRERGGSRRRKGVAVPRLEGQYRQSSRRTVRQQLQQWDEESPED